jgi:pimeloyl-ACP methyl ester carboxylesterase
MTTTPIDVRFPSTTGQCSAWLYLPPTASPQRPVPVIVMAQGLGGVKAMRLGAFADRFHAAGYACLVFDYRHFGGSDGQPRQLLSVRRQLQDWTAAVAYARTRPECDPDRVVVWGTSFGGGHALTMAARDHRLAAAIAQCPFTDGIASSLAVPPTMLLRVTALAVLDVLGALLRRRPILIPTAAAPGSVGLMTAPDCLPGYLSLADTTSREAGFDNRVSARTALDIARYAPGRRTKRITCAALFALCQTDSVAPYKTAHRQASRTQYGEVRLYPAGHFDIYLGDWFETNVTDQLAFLSNHVPVDV